MAAAKDEAPDENDDRRHRDERRETMASPAKDEAPDENENRRHQRDRQTTAVSGLLRLFEGSSRFFGFPNSSSSRASGRLSHVGRAAVRVLKWKHPFQYRTLWNTSAGRLVSLDDTPKYEQFNPDRVENHSEWFPEKVGELIAKTEIWCDIVSLGPPDGDFLYAIRAALEKLHVKDKVIIIRIMFGNIVGMPVNCKNVMKRLIKNIPKDSTKLRIWMGSWRRGITWNHAKFIAVDGRLLHTGGHNFWTRHYLRKSPVFDLSVELAGPVAHDGHVYANYPWTFISRKIRAACILRHIKSFNTWVTFSRFPHGLSKFPPNYTRLVTTGLLSRGNTCECIPIITVGRYGKLVKRMVSRQPSDDAILAMLGAARQSIRLVIQDLGPVCIPGTKITLPGSTWPHEYLSVLARAVWSKDVVVEIIVSNPLSIPDHVGVHQGVYGNGWSTEDVCAEILKKIRKHFPDADRNALREKLQEKLRVCYLRGEHGRTYEDGTRMALHSKHFIVDEQACYIGSQNLYVCDLAEWGVIIDHAVTVKQIMSEYWWPMWVRSFSEEDREIDVILDAMEIDRDGEDPDNLSAEMSKVFEEADRQFGQSVFGKSIKNFAQEGNIFTPDDIENYHIGEMIEDEE